MHNGHISLHTDNTFYAALIVTGIIALILLGSVLSYYIARYYILRLTEKLSRNPNYKWLKYAYHRRVFHRVALMIPGMVLYELSPLLANIHFSFIPALAEPAGDLTACYIILMGALAVLGLLNSLVDRYNHFEFAHQVPIKSYVQVAKMLLGAVTTLIIVSILMNKSPAYFLTGLGAMTALLAVVFKDSIQGFVTSIQLAAYDMVRLGDWIEVPGFGADGTVIDLSLNTVKVRNFDNTIVMLPSYALLSSGVKNWRGMSEAGARRIKRAVHIEPESVKFCNDGLISALKPLLGEDQTIDTTWTNLGALRIYIKRYLSRRPDVRQDMTLMVHELELEIQGARGIPLEIYAFTSDTNWENYVRTQSEIFEHIYAILLTFELKVFSK